MSAYSDAMAEISTLYKQATRLSKENAELRAELAELRKLPSITDGITGDEAYASAEFDLTIDEIRSFKGRAVTAERELAELRERVGEATVEWAVYWRSVRDHYEICETEDEAREAFDPDDPTYEVRSRVVGEWKAADDGR